MLLNSLAVFTPDTSLFSDAGTAITAVATAFVGALALGLAIPVGRKVYRMVKGAIQGA